MNPNEITLLYCKGQSFFATKRFPRGSSNSKPFNLGYTFRAETRTLSGIVDLSALLTELEPNTKCYVVRPALRDGKTADRIVRRARGADAPLVPVARSWIMVDFDGLDFPPDLPDFNADPVGAVEYTKSALPPEFHNADCHWRFSASMGLKPGLRVHLWFWLSRPITDAEAKAWLRGYPADQSIYNPGQPHFTANPIFDDPADDPVRVRSGLIHRGAACPS